MQEVCTTVAANDQVEYRDIPGFPGYRCGSDGTLWTCKRRTYPKGEGKGVKWVMDGEWNQKSLRTNPKGRTYCSLCDGTKERPFQFHVLMALCWFGPRPNGYHVCHNDGNPKNNRIENLRYDTPKGNNADKIRHGTAQRGENAGLAKLTNEKVREMRQLKSDGMTYKRIAEMFGITKGSAQKAVTGATWGHIR